MNTERDNPGGEARVPHTGWPRGRIVALALGAVVLLVIGGLFVAYMLPPSNPVEREVARIMDRARSEERGQRPWRAFVEAIKQRVFHRNNPAGPSDSPSEELEKLGEQAHPFLIPLVGQDPSPAVRRLAIEILANGNATNVLPVIARALEADGDIEVRAGAASALGELDPNAAVPRLLAALAREKQEFARPKATASDPWAQSRALDAIARTLGALKATNAMEPLLELLQSAPPKDVLSSVASALGELGDPRAAPALRGLLPNRDTSVHTSAIRALGQLRDRDSVPLLLGLMEQGITNAPASASGRQRSYGPTSNWDWENTRQTLAEALGRIGDRRATLTLVRALTNVVQDFELEKFIEAFAMLGHSQAIPALQTIMADHPKLAKDVAGVLVLLGHQSVTRELTALLGAPEREKRVAAALALANLGDKSVLTNLVHALNTGAGSDNRQHLVEALGIIGDATAVPALLAALNDAEEDVRSQSVWSLGNIGEPSAVGPLVQSLADTNFYVRFAAAFALIGLTNPAVQPALEARLDDGELRVRTAAASSLAFHGSARAVPALVAALRCSDDWQRLAAAMSLLRLNSPEARELVAGLNSDRDADLRELARLGLERGPVGALTNMLTQGTDNHRHYAARMLLFFDDPAALPALRGAVRDPRAEVRVAARVALRRLERHASTPGRQ